LSRIIRCRDGHGKIAVQAIAGIVSSERIVFNVKGNAYRLVVAVDIEKSIVWIKWIGTHKQYDRISVTKPA
jgi:mRNA interferase HigB